MPVRMSPVPPVAMPGIAGRIHPRAPVRQGDDGAIALQHQNQVMIAREAARDIEPVGLYCLDRDARQSRHLAGMRREHQRPPAAIEQIGLALEGVQPVGIDHQRNLGLVHRFVNELHRLRIAPDAGADGDHGHRLGQIEQSVRSARQPG